MILCMTHHIYKSLNHFWYMYMILCMMHHHHICIYINLWIMFDMCTWFSVLWSEQTSPAWTVNIAYSKQNFLNNYWAETILLVQQIIEQKLFCWYNRLLSRNYSPGTTDLLNYPVIGELMLYLHSYNNRKMIIVGMSRGFN